MHGRQTAHGEAKMPGAQPGRGSRQVNKRRCCDTLVSLACTAAQRVLTAVRSPLRCWLFAGLEIIPPGSFPPPSLLFSAETGGTPKTGVCHEVVELAGVEA